MLWYALLHRPTVLWRATPAASLVDCSNKRCSQKRIKIYKLDHLVHFKDTVQGVPVPYAVLLPRLYIVSTWIPYLPAFPQRNIIAQGSYLDILFYAPSTFATSPFFPSPDTSFAGAADDDAVAVLGPSAEGRLVASASAPSAGSADSAFSSATTGSGGGCAVVGTAAGGFALLSCSRVRFVSCRAGRR